MSTMPPKSRSDHAPQSIKAQGFRLAIPDRLPTSQVRWYPAIHMLGSTLNPLRILRATRQSIAGLRDAFRGEAAFRQELLLGAILVPIAVWLGDTGVERALMIAALLQVLIVELLNSAIETIVDRFGEEHHDLSRRAKDIGSAAVFISLVTVPVVWALVLLG